MKTVSALALFASLVSGAVPVTNDSYMSESEWNAYCKVAEPYQNSLPNSTGSLIFDSPFAASKDLTAYAKDPWYLTLTLDDFRPRNLDDMPNMDAQQLQLFLTVPETHARINGLELCTYSFEYEHPNATSTGRQGDESCEKDLIPADCLDLLTSTLKKGTCALPKDVGEELSEKCGFVGTSYGYEAMSFTHNACFATDVPYVNRPEGYITSIDMPVLHFMDDHQSARDFTNYDMRVQQVMPFVIVTSWPDTSYPAGKALGNLQTLCLSASNVTEGSRVPQKKANAQSEENKGQADESSETEESSKSEQSGEPKETRTREAAAGKTQGLDEENDVDVEGDDSSSAVATGASIALTSMSVMLTLILT